MTNLTRPRPRRARALLALTGIGLLIALSACAPNASDGASDGADLASGDAQAEYDDWSLEFGDCMKEQGVDVSMSGTTSSTETSDDSAATLNVDELDMEAMDAAHETCIEKVGEPPVQPGMPDADEMNEAMLAFAACMREAGYDFPDPEISSDGGVVAMQAMPADDIDPAVMDACNEEAGFPEMPKDDE
ncbi:hypothetical protein [Agromyces subbeticus]|uniref:hypothetical protein n=1 Tax=Agromyces subbeticus TaxID=293890 RepID=UPI0003B6D217|nr:hypothetical protein [Agromyces subbeticus]